jgi:hypothetical protein
MRLRMGQDLAALGNAEAPMTGLLRQRDVNKIGSLPSKVKSRVPRGHFASIR